MISAVISAGGDVTGEARAERGASTWLDKLEAAVKTGACFGVSLVVAMATASAQEPAGAFYKGRQITIVVGTGPGSSASLYAQLVGRHIGRALAGRPNVIVQHMPGAGGLLAANTAANTLARDGTALVTTNSTIFLEPLLGGKGAQFDAPRFSWIGGTHVERLTCIAWHTSAVKTLQDALVRPMIVGSYGADGPSAVFARAANTFAGTRFGLVTGYNSGPEALTAMERGEVEGFCAMGTHELKLRYGRWLTEKKVNILFQMGLKRDADYPDVPMLLDHARNDLDRKALELLSTPVEIGRPLYAPPGVPLERVLELRSALAQTTTDPLLLADAERSGLPIEHVGGDTIEAMIGRIYGSPRDVIDRAARIGD